MIADPGPVTTGGVLAAMSDRLGAEGAGSALGGLAVEGASVAEAAGDIAAITGGWWREGDGRLILCAGKGDGGERMLTDHGWRAAGAGSPGRRSMTPADRMPGAVTIAHYDPARDYQTGVQRAARPGAGKSERRIAMPAAIGADAALALAEAAMDRAMAERERRWIGAAADALTMNPGDRVRLSGEAGLWRAAAVTIERSGRRIELVRIADAAAVPLPLADPGRVHPDDDQVHGPTVIAAFELPLDQGSGPGVPRLAIATSGTEAGWRSAALMTAAPGGAWQPVGGSARAAVIGRAIVPPGPACPLLIDWRSAVIVALTRPGDMMRDADMAAVDRGENLALIGDELIQFMRADPLGEGRWRLTGLLRGRRSTEWAMAYHAPDEPFCLIEADALAIVDLTPGAIGSDIDVAAQGVGDPDLVREKVSIDGRSVRPPSPVRAIVSTGADGDIVIRWTRRSRTGWNWIDAIDAPLGESAERYRVTIRDSDGATRVHDTGVPEMRLGIDGRPRPWHIEIRQIGDLAASTPLSLALS
ncbi:phage tail protein [Sphingomonas sp. FW199]|uniref:GTA baseplate fiber-binding domain-containing protein n=1 Tax=Sphingomonas sp. FW199 TaxID=3400217 RepID=UPI003CFB3748